MVGVGVGVGVGVLVKVGVGVGVGVGVLGLITKILVAPTLDDILLIIIY
jgi:hypothetical protein